MKQNPGTWLIMRGFGLFFETFDGRFFIYFNSSQIQIPWRQPC